MSLPTLSRRSLLQWLSASGLVAPCAGLLAQTSSAVTAQPKPYQWLSATGAINNEYGVSWSMRPTHTLQTTYSGFRGHEVAIHPLRPNQALLFGRRPSMQAIEVDLNSAAITQTLKCAPNRHLFGHGCFSRDGQQLFTTEGDIEKGIGKIVVRDSKTYLPLCEFDSGGIGPHQIKLMPDGKTLAVANGGILTHPKSGRKKLNLPSMRSSLAYIDSHTGHCLNQLSVQETKASIRHLDIHPDGTVAIAMQVQREACNHNRTVPLAAVHKPQTNSLLTFQQPETLITQMQDYIGSVAIHSDLRIAGFTSPRGNMAAFWSIDSGLFLAYHRLHDACGIAISPDKNYFLLSNSSGEIRFIRAKNLTENRHLRQHYPNTQWDNHLLVI